MERKLKWLQFSIKKGKMKKIIFSLSLIIVSLFLFLFIQFEKEQVLVDYPFILEFDDQFLFPRKSVDEFDYNGDFLIYDDLLDFGFFVQQCSKDSSLEYQITQIVDGMENKQVLFVISNDSIKLVSNEKTYTMEKTLFYKDDLVSSKEFKLCETHSNNCKKIVANYIYNDEKIIKINSIFFENNKDVEGKILKEIEYQYDHNNLLTKILVSRANILDYENLISIINNQNFEIALSHVETLLFYDSELHLIELRDLSLSNELIKKTLIKKNEDNSYLITSTDATKEIFELSVEKEENRVKYVYKDENNYEEKIIVFNSKKDTLSIHLKSDCGFDCNAEKNIFFNNKGKRGKIDFLLETRIFNFFTFASLETSVEFIYNDGKINDIIFEKNHYVFTIPINHFFRRKEETIRRNIHFEYNSAHFIKKIEDSTEEKRKDKDIHLLNEYYFSYDNNFFRKEL